MRCRVAFVWVAVVLVGAGCRTHAVGGRDGELKGLVEAGQSAYEQGAPAKAALLYGKAYRRGLLIDQPLEAGRNAYNAALCHLAMGDVRESAAMLGEARRLLGDDAQALVKVDMAEAEAGCLRGDRKVAGELAKRVMAAGAGASERCQAAVLLAEIAQADEEMAAAMSWYKVACGARGKGLAPRLAARRDGVGARLAGGGMLKGSAGALYASQAAFLRDGGAYGEMAVALMKAGDAFTAEGRFVDAFGCYERAVNSWLAAGDKTAASGGVVKAVGLGARLTGEVFEERIRLLRQSVGQ